MFGLLVKVLTATLTVYSLCRLPFEPGIKLLENQAKATAVNGPKLIEALDWAAANGETQHWIRKIALKPGSALAAYYEMTTNRGPYLLRIYKTGVIEAKASEAPEWERYASPAELNRMYRYLNATLATETNFKVEGVSAKDFESAVGTLLKAPKALDGLRP